MIAPLKLKYRDSANRIIRKNGAMRMRTGPKCCNDGCAAKARKFYPGPYKRGPKNAR